MRRLLKLEQYDDVFYVQLRVIRTKGTHECNLINQEKVLANVYLLHTIKLFISRPISGLIIFSMTMLLVSLLLL